MNYYNRGTVVGVAKDFAPFNFQAIAGPLATKIFAQNPLVQRVTVTMGPSGTNPLAVPFGDIKLASDASEEIRNAPGGIAYLATFAPEGIIDEQLFGNVIASHTSNKVTVKSVAGWVAAGLASVFGLVLLRKGKK